MDTLLKGIRTQLFLKEQSELDCRGGANAANSLYVLNPNNSSFKLNKNDIVKGIRKTATNKFAVKILSIRRIGSYVALECLSLAQLDKLKRFSIEKDYAYMYSKVFGYDLNARGELFFF